ncbi:unnamed protein product [Urochloa humidicola]
MDAKVIVSAYEELPRRRRPVPINRVAPTAAAARAKASAPPRQASSGGGGYSRRALLLAYAQQQRRRRRGEQQQQEEKQRGAPLLEWGEWKAAGRVAGGDVAVNMFLLFVFFFTGMSVQCTDSLVWWWQVTRAAGAGRRRSWCSRLRSCARLWIWTFFRGARRIGERASCKK